MMDIITVVDTPNVIAEKGDKRVGQAMSAERDTLVTMCTIVRSDGNSLPPVFVFPRAKYHESFLTGSIGLINHPASGWMTKALFLQVLEHIKIFTKCSRDEIFLIVMNNHKSHCSLEAVIFEK